MKRAFLYDVVFVYPNESGREKRKRVHRSELLYILDYIIPGIPPPIPAMAAAGLDSSG